MKQIHSPRFSLAERIKIVHEYETSNLTLAEISAKYGILGSSTISQWRHRLYNSKKSSTFAGEIKTGIVMNDPERQELEHQIADLERRLQKEQMKNLALNTLIDVAEEQGIQIRKKSGAKQ